MHYDEMLTDENIAAEVPVTAVPPRCYRAMFAQRVVPSTVGHLLRDAARWLAGEVVSPYSDAEGVSQDRFSL